MVRLPLYDVAKRLLRTCTVMSPYVVRTRNTRIDVPVRTVYGSPKPQVSSHTISHNTQPQPDTTDLFHKKNDVVLVRTVTRLQEFSFSRSTPFLGEVLPTNNKIDSLLISRLKCLFTLHALQNASSLLLLSVLYLGAIMILKYGGCWMLHSLHKSTAVPKLW
jgi:hypothetical protein